MAPHATYNSKGFNIQAFVDPHHVRFDWHGELMSPSKTQDEPPELTQFLQNALYVDGQPIEKVEFHFEDVREIRSSIMRYLIKTVTQMLTRHKQVTLFHLTNTAQDRDFKTLKQVFEGLRKNGSIRETDGIIDFKPVTN